MEAPASERSSHSRKDERFPNRQSFRRGFDDKKIKEEDRSHDLKEKTQLFPKSPSGATADRTAKCDPQYKSPKGIPKRFLSISDEISEMMKRVTRCSEDFKKLAETKHDRVEYKNKTDGCKVKTEKR